MKSKRLHVAVGKIAILLRRDGVQANHFPAILPGVRTTIYPQSKHSRVDRTQQRQTERNRFAPDGVKTAVFPAVFNLFAFVGEMQEGV